MELFSGAADPRSVLSVRRRGSQFGDFTPHLESATHFGAVIGGGHTVPGRAEVRGDATERGQESLGRADSAEPFHRPFALPGRLVGVLGPIIQVCRLPVFDRRHGGPVRDLVAAELVGGQFPRPGAVTLLNATNWENVE